MNTNSEAYYIGECLALIEAKWQRGGREDIVGVQYRFTGVCAVRNARFTGGGHSFDLE